MSDPRLSHSPHTPPSAATLLRAVLLLTLILLIGVVSADQLVEALQTGQVLIGGVKNNRKFMYYAVTTSPADYYEGLALYSMSLVMSLYGSVRFIPVLLGWRKAENAAKLQKLADFHKRRRPSTASSRNDTALRVGVVIIVLVALALVLKLSV